MPDSIEDITLAQAISVFVEAITPEPFMSRLWQTDPAKPHYFCGTQEAIDGVRRDIASGILNADDVVVVVPR